MIVKLITAYGRWMWGVSPAFFEFTQPIGEGDALVIGFSVMIDIMAVIGVIGSLALHWPFKKKG